MKLIGLDLSALLGKCDKDLRRLSINALMLVDAPMTQSLNE